MASHYYTAWALGSVGFILNHMEYLPGMGLSTYTNTHDFLLRSESNGLPVLSSYPVWTALWWITKLEIVAYLSRATRSELSTGVVLHLLQLCLLITCVLRLSDPFLTANVFSLNGLRDRHEEPNLLLLNPINKIHPGLLYLSTAPLWYILTLQSEPLSSGRYTHNLSSIWRIHVTWYYFYIMTFTLMLGGYWAAQEGSWGSWWNWDPSEEAGLLMMLIYILDAHIVSRKRWFRELAVLGWWRLGVLGIASFTITVVFEATNHNFSIEGGLRVWEGSRSLLVSLAIYTLMISYYVRILQMPVKSLYLKINYWSYVSRNRLLQPIFSSFIILLFGATTLPLLKSAVVNDSDIINWGGGRIWFFELPYPSLALILGRLYFTMQLSNLALVLNMGWTSGVWSVPPTLTYSLTAVSPISLLHFIPMSACINVTISHDSEAYSWYLHESQLNNLFYKQLYSPEQVYLESSHVGLRSRICTTTVNYTNYDNTHLYYQSKCGVRKPLLASFLYSSRGRGLVHQIVEGSYSHTRFRSVSLTCGDYGLIGFAGATYIVLIFSVTVRSRSWLY